MNTEQNLPFLPFRKPNVEFPSREEKSLGALDYDAVSTALQQLCKKKQKSNTFSDEERYLIGKCAFVHGPGATVSKFRRSQPYLTLFKTSGELASIPQLKQGRSFMLGELDEIMKNLLHVLRRTEGVVNTVMADATAKSVHLKKSE